MPGKESDQVKELTIWCESLKRHRLNLVDGDVTSAIKWFRTKTGQDAVLVVLHPSNRHFAKEVSDGIEVEFRDSCLGFEVGLSAEEEKAAPKMATLENYKDICEAPTLEKGEARRGRPQVHVSEDIIKGPGSIRHKARIAGVSFGTMKRRLGQL